MDKKINFLHTCREAAAEAEKLFGMNARISSHRVRSKADGEPPCLRRNIIISSD